jgi:hypothetical protein
MTPVRRRSRRGIAAIAMIIAMLIVGLMVTMLAANVAREQDLTVRRLETVQAFYAAEGGMNMGARELVLNTDEDGDGEPGSISDDEDDGTDPSIGVGTVHVAVSWDAGQATLTSESSAGLAGRRLEAKLESSVIGPGLAARYFASASAPASLSDIDFTAVPDAIAIVTQINWPRESQSTPFWAGGPNSNYGAEFTGRVDVPQAGVWTFYTESDDGSKLWIDGMEIVDNDGLHGMIERSGAITLTQGSHTIMIRYFERGGNHGLIASWQGPGSGGKNIIPAGALSH